MEENKSLTVSNKEKYRELCDTESTICIFSKACWMDAVCGSDCWDVLLVEEQGEIVGALVYYFIESGKRITICQPPFTQSNGVWIKYPPNQKYEKKLSYEKKIMNDLIEQLEKLPIISYMQCFSTKITNWLPFYWKGYQQTTYYSYRIMDISDIEQVEKNFSSAKRRNIRRAMKENIQVKYDLPAEEFYMHHKRMLELEGKTISYSYDLFKRMYDTCYQNGAGFVIYAEDEQKNVQAAIFIIYDAINSYQLILINYPEYRNNGTLTLLTYEAIKRLSGKIQGFDMEGSMIETVENSYRQFGTVQLPYFVIKKEFVTKPQLIFDKGVRKLKRILKGK